MSDRSRPSSYTKYINIYIGNVATGIVRYLLNIVYILHLDVRIISFPIINLYYE